MDILSEAKGPLEDYIPSEGLGHTSSKVTRNALMRSSALFLLCMLGLIVGEAVTDGISLTAVGMTALPFPTKPQRPGGHA